MAACLWSALPEENAMQIRDRIIRSADRYINPDNDQYGYGIPNAWKAYTMTPTGVESVTGYGSRVTGQKILRNGQMLIIHGDKTYNVLGVEIKE